MSNIKKKVHPPVISTLNTTIGLSIIFFSSLKLFPCSSGESYISYKLIFLGTLWNTGFSRDDSRWKIIRIVLLPLVLYTISPFNQALYFWHQLIAWVLTEIIRNQLTLKIFYCFGRCWLPLIFSNYRNFCWHVDSSFALWLVQF